MNKREEFEKLLKQLETIAEQFNVDKEVVMKDYLYDLRSEYIKLHKYTKKVDTRDEYWLRDKLPEDVFMSILNEHQPLTKKLIDSYYNERREIKDKLSELAQELDPIPGNKKLKLTTVWESTYSSQGLGSFQYAKREADQHVLLCETHNVKAEVEVETRRFKASPIYGGGSSSDFKVYAYVRDETDIEILLRKTMSLRDMVKWCWGNGVNPRVYNPFIPHGYEEKVGLDYFGNEKEKGYETF